MWFPVITFSLLLRGVTPYYGGAPPGACATMTPSHQGSAQDAGSSPYKISLSNTTYSPNDKITVTISGIGDTKFRGFFIQPRSNVNTASTIGTFSSTADGHNPCINSAALTHVSGVDKPSLTFTWNAPASDQGPVVFVYTMVRVKMTYWVKLQSDTVTFVPPTTDNPGTITRDSECGTTKGCFPSPAECSTNCDYLLSWTDNGVNDVTFSFKMKSAAGDSWIAVGLSYDPNMGNDSVTECVSTGGVVAIQSSYNPAAYNDVLSNPQYGITNISSSHVNGVISCTFSRKKSAALVSPGTVEDANRFFDLEKDWYIFIAHGPATGGVKDQHQQTPVISTVKIDFQQTSENTYTTTEALLTGSIGKNLACGVSMGCFSKCSSDDDCDLMFTWVNRQDSVDFSIACKRSGNGYCAIGLSYDKIMGDDSVLECVSDGASVLAFSSFNTKGQRANSRLDNQFLGLKQTSGSIHDGILRCTFSRMKTHAMAMASSGRKKRAVTDESTYFDLNGDYYLLAAYGRAIAGFISKHTAVPLISSGKADFQSAMDLDADNKKDPLIITHGVMMVVGWMVFASIGIVTARFYKPAWPEDATLCGQKHWFIIHRACMIAALCCCIVGFVVIFVYIEGYAEISGTDFAKSHPIIGIVVMALTITNPVMAMFRCHPGTSKRPVFNWAHWGVGTSAYICSIVNIFSACTLVSAGLPDYTKIILWIYVGWVLVLEIFLYIHDLMKKKKETAVVHEKQDSDTSQQYELRQKGSTDALTTNKPAKQTFKLAVLGLHAAVVVALSIAVCVIVAVGKHDHDDDD